MDIITTSISFGVCVPQEDMEIDGGADAAVSTISQNILQSHERVLQTTDYIRFKSIFVNAGLLSQVPKDLFPAIFGHIEFSLLMKKYKNVDFRAFSQIQRPEHELLTETLKDCFSGKPMNPSQEFMLDAYVDFNFLDGFFKFGTFTGKQAEGAIYMRRQLGGIQRDRKPWLFRLSSEPNCRAITTYWTNIGFFHYRLEFDSAKGYAWQTKGDRAYHPTALDLLKSLHELSELNLSEFFAIDCCRDHTVIMHPELGITSEEYRLLRQNMADELYANLLA
jgi:hypothetical protein